MAKDSGIITLEGENGVSIDFYEVAEIPYEGITYLILQPVELLEGMEEDEALVFSISDLEDGMTGFNIVEEDEIIDAIFEIYNKLLDESNK